MKLTDNVMMLELDMNGSIIYPTLISGNGHLILVDAGVPGMADAIVKAIADEGFHIENLTEIILTHQDIDHVGSVLDLLKLAPKAKVLAHVEEAPYIDGRKTPIKLGTMLANYDNLPEESKTFCNIMKEAFSKHIPVSQTLTDGEVLPYCGGIEIVHTPGHTPGHICLYLRESKIMVGGDAINIENGKLIGSNPKHTYDTELGIKSLEKVNTFDMTGVISYHCGYLKV